VDSSRTAGAFCDSGKLYVDFLRKNKPWPYELVVKPRQPLCDLNPFESIFLILQRVGVGARVVPAPLPELPLRASLWLTGPL
jgi:hypothetical protein